jgi:predicted metal-dependent hydrolase
MATSSKGVSALDITYKFSPRRRSIGLQVTTEGKLVVTAPAGASRASIGRALERHRDWIERTSAARQEAWERLRPGTAYLLGQAYRLVVVPGGQESVELSSGEIRVRQGPRGPAVWLALKDWYWSRAGVHLGMRVQAYAAKMGLKPRLVELRDWKRRWGECHLDGKLRFNWRLILLSPAVIDYVVVHELAHLQVAGHNPRFWRAVEAVLPDYAQRRQWLNRDGSPLLLWQAG